MGMFAKLMSRITESSLMEEPLAVRYCFMMMLAIADPHGYVIGTDVAIARRLNMPVAEFRECLAELMKPDEDSNSKEQDGRRITESDCERGYFVVNYAKYRDTRDEEHRREYMRKYMRKKRSEKELQHVSSRKQRKPLLAKAEAEVKEEGRGEISAHAEFIKLWTDEYPKFHGGDTYAFQSAKDGAAVKSLLSTSQRTPQELLRIAVAAWRVPAGFNTKMAASLCGFNSKFNEIRADLNTAKGAAPAPPVRCAI